MPPRFAFPTRPSRYSTRPEVPPTRPAPFTPIGSVFMLRRLRVLAAFFMVPVVLLQPTAAQAAEWHTVSLHAAAQYLSPDAVPGTYDTIDCSFSLRQTGTHAISLGTGSCFGLPDVTWGYTQPGEAGSAYTISLEGQTGTSSTCEGSMSSVLGPHAKNGTLRVAGTITPGEIGVSAPDCSITQVCISFGSGLTGMDDCVTVDIPAEEEEDPSGGTCAAGTPVFTYEWRKVGENMAGYYKWDLVLKLGLTGAPATTARWFAAVQGNYGRSATEELVTAETVFKHVEWEPVAPARPTGVEVYKAPMVDGATVWQQDFDSEALLIGTEYPNTPSKNFAGWTQPELCRFWFGPKVVFSDTTEADEPAGDGLTAPEPEEPEVPPEPVVEEPEVPVEPETEAGFWGAILALLRTIWSAITGGLSAVVTAVGRVVSALTGLAGSIADAIMDGLEGAFVPADGYMETKWSGVSNKWSDTAPAKYAGTFENFTTGSTSGCEGLPLRFTLPGGVEVDQRLGAACSGQMATAAGITQSVLTGVFGIGGALACVRAIGSGLGWNPNVGRPGGAV